MTQVTDNQEHRTMLCPKCHQPLADADDGPYICCAGAAVEWQCSGCGKVSEGFAFPYGRCPQCGGTLALRDAAAVALGLGAEAGALAAVRTAFEIELGARAFYQRAAADYADATLRALFRRFAVMEGEHMETLARRYHVDVPDPPAQFRLETAALYAGTAERIADPADLLRIAIGFEKRAADYFAEHARQAAAGSAERRLHEELAAEEREHAQILVAELARWREQRPGLYGTEAAPAGAPLNGAELLLAAHDAASIAIECDGRRMSYGELRDRVARAGALWRARGVRPGDRVAVKLPDGFDWVVAWLGAIWAGGIAVGVNPKIPAPEWQYILDEAGFDVIIADGSDDTPPPWRARVVGVEEGRRAVSATPPMAALQVPAETPAFWVHSSGTSGKPKAVVHAHRCLREIGRISAERFGIAPGDRLFASSRLFFAYPLTNLLLAGLRLGATLILDAQWPNAASVAATVARTRPTVLFSVPSLYRDLLHQGLASTLTSAGVRLCVSAGEALPPQLRERWVAASGLPVVDGYGASETLVLVMQAKDARGFAPSPGVEVRALDDVAPGVPTRLLIRTPMLALGYLDRPQAQAETFRDGAFCPADLWQRDADGFWQFAGREDSLVKIRGRWVNLIELGEQLAASARQVQEGAAVCVPDADGVDAVAYFYVAADAAHAQAALQARAATLPQHQRPRWLHAVDSLPRGPTGKLLRRKLQELHERLALMQPPAAMGHFLPPAERGFQHE
jgi:acyl-coenzyme A synthetase/AMP-(fatty) acid ligase/rubrerythrin